MLIDGAGAFLHENGCLPVAAGDLVIYETRQPYLFGFSSSMRQILVDIPREEFVEACSSNGVRVPMLFGRESAHEAAHLFRLRTLLAGLVALPGDRRDPAQTQHAVLELLGLLIVGRRGGSTPATAHLISARDHIERRLHDPQLDAAQVASALGISVRHLARVFETVGTTPTRHILERRLQRANDQLGAPSARETRIADVAYRWGFSSQAHFARAFHHRFGRTPSQTRAGAPTR